LDFLVFCFCTKAIYLYYIKLVHFIAAQYLNRELAKFLVLTAPVPTNHPVLLKEHISEYLKTVVIRDKIGIFYFSYFICLLDIVEGKEGLRKK